MIRAPYLHLPKGYSEEKLGRKKMTHSGLKGESASIWENFGHQVLGLGMWGRQGLCAVRSEQHLILYRQSWKYRVSQRKWGEWGRKESWRGRKHSEEEKEAEATERPQRVARGRRGT